jgi:putative ABC transport system substrate-binding protein
MRRIGILEMATPDKDRLDYWRIFSDSMTTHGYSESRDFTFEYRWAHGHQDRLAAAARELVDAAVDVIITAGTPAAAAAIRATSTLPIVMATGVSLGAELSDNSAPPVRNVTGISDLPAGVSDRRLTLLREALGTSASLAILADRDNPSSPLAVQETRVAAKTKGIEVADYWVSGPDHFDATLAEMRKDGVRGFVVAPGAMFFAKRAELARCALKHGLGAMAVRREYAEAGALMAYGAPLLENYRAAASLVSRILGGASPAELPVAEPTTFDFLINTATAAQLGVEIPAALLQRAEKTGGV